MRQATLLLVPEDQGFDPADIAIAEEPSLTRQQIHYINVLDENTLVTLYEVQGDVRTAVEILEDRTDVFTVDAAGQNEGVIYIHLEATEPTKSLAKILDQKQVVPEYPLRYTDRGLKISLVGTSEALQAAADEFAAIVRTELVQRGEYRSGIEQIASLLTDRQMEILTRAVEMGYFEYPRNSSYQEIADEFGVDQSTVAEHLQRVESKVLSQIVY